MHITRLLININKTTVNDLKYVIFFHVKLTFNLLLLYTELLILGDTVLL